MSMSRKDYTILAGAINKAFRSIKPEHRGAVIHTAEHIALALSEDNPRFARERFMGVALNLDEVST